MFDSEFYGICWALSFLVGLLSGLLTFELRVITERVEFELLIIVGLGLVTLWAHFLLVPVALGYGILRWLTHLLAKQL